MTTGMPCVLRQKECQMFFSNGPARSSVAMILPGVLETQARQAFAEMDVMVFCDNREQSDVLRQNRAVKHFLPTGPSSVLWKQARQEFCGNRPVRSSVTIGLSDVQWQQARQSLLATGLSCVSRQRAARRSVGMGLSGVLWQQACQEFCGNGHVRRSAATGLLGNLLAAFLSNLLGQCGFYDNRWLNMAPVTLPGLSRFLCVFIQQVC